jgi:2-polyprenyl-3-methyl-5-hydroxy-6-metoxy-1,4-benzoquinol methylase
LEIPATGNSGILNQYILIIANDILSSPPYSAISVEKFEELYIASRQKEKRIYSDAQVSRLPDTDINHIHAGEWKVRKRSAARLLKLLRKKNRPLNILEVGCGNGWLSDKLAGLMNSTVMGIDINEVELIQAKRVFGYKDNIQFAIESLNSVERSRRYDVIVFAASIQYFPDLHKTIQTGLSLLNPDGEIHILDSHFYHRNEIQAAIQRSHSYYQAIGFEEMADRYFHHAFESLSGFHQKKLFDPLHLKNKIFLGKDPFPWICIKAS